MKSASILVLASLFLAGCALEPLKPRPLPLGEKVIPQIVAPTVNADGYRVFYAQLNKQLGDADLLAKRDDSSARYLEVTVTNYFMRRYLERSAPVQVRQDMIQSTVKIKDRTTGETLSEFDIGSSGALFATTSGMIQLHVEAIVKALQTGSQ